MNDKLLMLPDNPGNGRKDKETHFLDLEEVLVALDYILIFDKDNSVDYE